MLENPEDIYEFKNIAKILHTCFNEEQVSKDNPVIKIISDANNGVVLGLSFIAKIMEQFILCNGDRYSDVEFVLKSPLGLYGERLGIEMTSRDGFIIDLDDDGIESDDLFLHKELCLVRDILSVNSDKIKNEININMNMVLPNSLPLISYGTHRGRVGLMFNGCLYKDKLRECIDFVFDSLIDKLVIGQDMVEIKYDKVIGKNKI